MEAHRNWHASVIGPEELLDAPSASFVHNIALVGQMTDSRSNEQTSGDRLGHITSKFNVIFSIQ